MICSKCNAEIPDNSKFCPVCGNNNQQTVANKFCGNCGTALPAGAMFCSECGASTEAKTAQPVMAGAASAPTVSAIPTPVNDPAPAVSAVPTPVNDPAPAESAVPTPVNDPAPTANAIPTPAAMTAPTGGVNLNKGSEALAGFEMPAVAAAAPAKKKSKLGLWIGLGVGAVVIAAAAVIGLGFRGVATNLVVGNNKYASMLEGDSIKLVSKEMQSAANNEMVSASADRIVSSALATFNTIENFESSSEDSAESAIESINFEQMISTYYQMMMEQNGINYAEYTFDVNLELTDAAKSAMGLEDTTEFDKIISEINGAKLTTSAVCSEDTINGYFAISDKSGFTLDAKGIICSDGSMGVMFPFSGEKCIAVKLDTNGEVVETEEVKFDIDEKEMERICNEIINIYLANVEKAEAKVTDGTEVTAGGVTVKGRLVTSEMTAEVIEQMFSEMLTFLANDSYATKLLEDIGKEIGSEYDTEHYKEKLLEAAEEIKGTVEFAYTIETLVDNNSNILAKSYIVKDLTADDDNDDDFVYEENETQPMMEDFEISFEDGEASEIKTTFISTEKNTVISGFADGKEMMYVIIEPTNETDGKIRVVLGDDNTEVSVNVDYEGVKTVKYLNQDMLIGKFTVYAAGTMESLPEGSSVKIVVEYTVNDKVLTTDVNVKVEPYGSFGITSEMKGGTVDADKIPSGAYIITNDEAQADSISKEGAQYIKDMLTDIVTVFEKNSDSIVASSLTPFVNELISDLDGVLNPAPSYEEVSTLTDDLSDLCQKLNDTYAENISYISTDIYDELNSLFMEIGDFSGMIETRYVAGELTKTDFEGYQSMYGKYSDRVDKLVEKVENIAKEAKNQNGSVVGFYEISTVIYEGTEFLGSDIFDVYTIEIKNDGTAHLECDGEMLDSNWEVVGTSLYIFNSSDDRVTLEINGNTLVLNDIESGIIMNFEKR